MRIIVTPAPSTGQPPGVLAIGLLASGRPLDGLDGLGLPALAAETVSNYLRQLPAAEQTRLASAGSLERLALATSGPSDPRLILLVGVSDGSVGELRAAGAVLARSAGCEAITLALPGLAPGPILPGASTAALVEGLLLGGYQFGVAAATTEPALTVTIRGADDAGLTRGRATGTAAQWARELANTRSGVKTPAWLAAQARAELGPLGVTVLERDVEWLAENRFGGILAVGGGSASPPRLIEASWRPRGARPDRHVVLVGKSITYDSGGINLKPLDSMISMYTDMAGGAAVLGALRIVAELELPIRVTALLPAAENSVSGSAMREGDVIRHYGGRTSEVNNTDAEGRLVLADALAYAAARLKPTVLVDLATLTGAMKVALGNRTAGFFATDDALADALVAAGDAAGEPLWRLPLADEYLSSINSDIADANNSPGNPGGIAAALFLRPFAGPVPWAHLDIAGPARASVDDGEISRGATGYGARLLAEWLLASVAA